MFLRNFIMNGRIERRPAMEAILELYSEPNYHDVAELLEQWRRAARRKRIWQEFVWWGFFLAFIGVILWRDRL